LDGVDQAKEDRQNRAWMPDLQLDQKFGTLDVFKKRGRRRRLWKESLAENASKGGGSALPPEPTRTNRASLLDGSGARKKAEGKCEMKTTRAAGRNA